MGKNFFGIIDACAHFSVIPAKQQVAFYNSKVPFTESILEVCKDTHILIAIFSLSALDIREQSPNLFYEQSWSTHQVFEKNKGKLGWQLIRKTPVPDSFKKNWDEQQVLLHEDETTPSAQVMVYTLIGHWKKTSERLFKKVFVRCSDLDSGGDRVHVGDYSGRLLVSSGWEGGRHSDLGVSASRKSYISKR
jgi:hypothetical protein